MAQIQQQLSPFDYLKRPWRLLLFLRRLQWKLTLAYALSTVLTVLVLAGVGMALLWYLYYWSNWLPNIVADALLKVTPALTPYLAQTPPDEAGLNNWLDKAMIGDDLIVEIPPESRTGSEDDFPAQFGQVVAIAITDRQGRVLAAFPAEYIAKESELSGQLEPEIVPGFQAALQGETDPGRLGIRDAANHIVISAPIFSADNASYPVGDNASYPVGDNASYPVGDNASYPVGDKQVLGAIFVKLVFPIEQSEFLQVILQGTVLPVGIAILIVGVLAGVFFGFFIARSLSRRLHALAGAADAWSKGNFEVLVPDNSGDELGQLAHRLNHMALQLQTLLQTRQELATLEERNRLARDLHDSVKQQVFATSMQVGAALALFEQNPAAAKTRLMETERLVRQAQQELTTLIQELRPAALEDKGLTAALREYVADWSRQSNIAAEVRVRGEKSLPLLLEQTLFRVTQEALANIARHSGATAAEVSLAWEEDHVILTITDNGRGFNPATANGKGIGLHSIRERVEAVGGKLSLTSQPEAGTKVVVCCEV